MGNSERDFRNTSEEDKKKKLEWGTYLKAFPRKGRTKEKEKVNILTKGKQAIFVTNNNTTKSRDS